MNEAIRQIFQGIVDGDQEQVTGSVEAALQAGVPARTILDEGMLSAMAEVGRLFEEGECYVPERTWVWTSPPRPSSLPPMMWM